VLLRLPAHNLDGDPPLYLASISSLLRRLSPSAATANRYHVAHAG